MRGPVVLTCVAAGLAAGCFHGEGGVPHDSPRADGLTRVGAGISVRRPPGWHAVGAPITSLSSPSDRLLLTSYPTVRGGNCAPDAAERDLPPDGALVYLFEYRPRVGDPWSGLRRGNFPPRPERFALRRGALAHYECWRLPTYLIRFRAADRPFQVHVALGPRAGAARRTQVLRAMDSLRIEPLPPPPPDPYAGWRELVDETGDTIRTPPGWPTGVTTSPRRYPRPRALFFATNFRLPWRPRTRRLSSPLPERALAALPSEAVLLWVLERRKGPPSYAFPPLPDRAWPRADDFRPYDDGPAARRPWLRWERAAAGAQRHRFEVWIVSGPEATEADLALARMAGASLALSTGDHRDRRCERACLTG